MCLKSYLSVVFFMLFFNSCQWTAIQPSPIVSVASTKTKQATVSSLTSLPTLAIIPNLHSANRKELENFCSMLHNIVAPYVHVLDYRVVQQIPPSVSPLDLATFFQLKLARADFLLYVTINFESYVDVQGCTSWTRGQVELRLISQIDGRCLWPANASLEQGVVNWKGVEYAKRITVKQLIQKIKNRLIKQMKSLPPLSKNQIKVSVQLDTMKQLELFQEELERLERSGYYKIIQTPILLAPMLMVRLRYSDSLLHLASLLKKACLSRGIEIKVDIGRQRLFIKTSE